MLVAYIFSPDYAVTAHIQTLIPYRPGPKTLNERVKSGNTHYSFKCVKLERFRGDLNVIFATESLSQQLLFTAHVHTMFPFGCTIVSFQVCRTVSISSVLLE